MTSSSVRDIMKEFSEQFGNLFVFQCSDGRLFGPFNSFQDTVSWGYKHKEVGTALPLFKP